VVVESSNDVLEDGDSQVVVFGIDESRSTARQYMVRAVPALCGRVGCPSGVI
jgi:hypothetical protein